MEANDQKNTEILEVNNNILNNEEPPNVDSNIKSELKTIDNNVTSLINDNINVSASEIEETINQTTEFAEQLEKLYIKYLEVNYPEAPKSLQQKFPTVNKVKLAHVMDDMINGIIHNSINGLFNPSDTHNNAEDNDESDNELDINNFDHNDIQQGDLIDDYLDFHIGQNGPTKKYSEATSNFVEQTNNISFETKQYTENTSDSN